MNGTAASLLGLLLEGGPMTGAETARTAALALGDFWTLTRSQVYRELQALEARGHLAAGEPGPRDARAWSVTDSGRAAFLDWLDRDPAAETVRFPLLVTVAFGRHLPPGRLAQILDRHEAVHRERLAHYRELDTALADSGDLHSRATLSFGVHYEEAVLAWFAGLPPEVRRG